MKISVKHLRALIREAVDWRQNVLPTSTIDALNALASAAKKSASFDQKIDLDKKTIQLKTTDTGFEASINGTIFGTGKTPQSALKGVKQRLQFLMTNLGYQEYDVEKARQASIASDYAELEKRKKQGW